MKVGYLGPEGTFSEEAGKVYAKKLEGKVEMIPYSTLHDILYAADKSEIAEAVVPIENSIDGTIGTVTDLLVKEVDLKICQELVLPVFHYLLAKKGVKTREISDVISNPPPLEQCKDFLRKKMPKAKLHLAYSTSDAARQVAQSPAPFFAAIGTLSAAKLYGLSIVAKKINAKDNETRFVILSKKDHKRTGDDKTSIVFSIAKDKPGGLHDILAEFAKRDINLTKIESRPGKRLLGDYYFFADMQGYRDDAIIKEALSKIKSKAAFFRLLGSYPRFKQKRRHT
jgi:prephenate dehydratase